MVPGERADILIVNDDGVAAPGIAALSAAVADLGRVIVVAPLEQMSGTGCGLSLGGEIEVRETAVSGAVRAFGLAGTPATCVKLALRQILAAPPRLVLSGINQGTNAGINVFYSGTVGAAIEAAWQGLPAMAVSQDIAAGDDFASSAALARELTRQLLNGGAMPQGSFLSVNVPADWPSEGGRVLLARQATPGAPPWVEGLPADEAGLREGYATITAMAIHLACPQALAWALPLIRERRPGP